MQQQRRICAYGVCHASGGVLLAHESGTDGTARWSLPGGAIRQGEHPAEAVVREVAAQTGLAVEVVRHRGVTADLVVRPSLVEHTDAIVYDLAVTGGTAAGGFQWLPAIELPMLPLTGLAAYTFGQRPPPGPALPAFPPPPPAAGAAPRARSGQRFGVYGLVDDPAGRVLLTRIADRYPGAGQWHLPGGGTDFGEQPVAGLLRELSEESGQAGQVAHLLTVTHRHKLNEYGPEGHAMDWHAVRAVYHVNVPRPTRPQVLDPGGSTSEAGWFTHQQAGELLLTELAADQLGIQA